MITLRGQRVRIRASPASYAASRAAIELRQAEATLSVIQELLKPPDVEFGVPILEYLLDPLAAVDADLQADSQAVVRVVEPELPGDIPVADFVRICISRWYGADAATADLFVTGLAGVVAARARLGAPLTDATAHVHSELEAGHGITIFQSPSSAVATAFVSYLLTNYGAAQLRQFLAAYDPTRGGEAAITAFRGPPGELEEAWLAHLKRDAQRGATLRNFLHHLAPLVKPYRARQLELVAYMVLNMSYGLTLPLGAKYLVDNVIPTGNVPLLIGFVFLVAGVYMANAALGVRRAFVAGWITQLINAALSERLFEHLQRLSHSFYGRAKVGDLLARMSSDLSVIQQTVAMVLGTVIFLSLTTLVAAVTVLVLDPLLGVLVLIVVPLFAVSYSLLRGRLQQASLEMQNAAGQAAAGIQENLSAHEVIKAFSLEQRAARDYHGLMQAYLKAAMQMIVRSAMFESSLMLAIMVSQTVVLGAGGYLAMEGRLSTGTLLAFTALLPTLFQPVATLSSVAGMIQRASGAMDRVTELLDEPVTISDPPDAPALPPLQHEIRFESVTFGYTPDRPTLNDIDLSIAAGTHVAIVGPSGAGKSSLVSLLLRFWDPDAGRIEVDGYDLREVTLESLRKQIGIVFQDTFVFDTTVRENIAIGRAGATDAEIAAAARAARLDDYIASLPAGFDTVLGERGVRMSGGQRQRLAIARALLRDPRILVLDEATSALDAHTEREILDTLIAVSQGRTTVTVTHRMSLAAVADCIVVLEAGRIVEQGSHATLVTAGGLYQRLWDEHATLRSAGGAAARVDGERLRAVPLFACLGTAPLISLAARLSFERYAAGEDIVREGEAGDRLYVIAQGEVDVLSGVPPRRINILGPGDYFGEMALLSGRPRSATVRATQPTELYALHQSDFLALLHNQPSVQAAVNEVIAERQAR